MVAAAAIATPFIVRAVQRDRARRAVSDYVLALRDSLRTLDATLLENTAMPREIGRVRSYFILLDAERTTMDAEVLGLDVQSVRSTDPTVTAVVSERWRYTERDLDTGRIKSEPTEETQTMRYTLLPSDGRLKVYLSEIVEGPAR